MNGMTGRRRAIPLSHAMAIHRAACRTIVVEGMRPDSEFAPDSALEEAVSSEPVSVSWFPGNSVKYREFVRKRGGFGSCGSPCRCPAGGRRHRDGALLSDA